eukprot:CCRYP_000313-RC/>CCRYP_000313-RC protein AED:0.42 eAED:0.42 QI:935/0.75/0.6/1/0/0/5/0/172
MWWLLTSSTTCPFGIIFIMISSLDSFQHSLQSLGTHLYGKEANKRERLTKSAASIEITGLTTRDVSSSSQPSVSEQNNCKSSIRGFAQRREIGRSDPTGSRGLMLLVEDHLSGKISTLVISIFVRHDRIAKAVQPITKSLESFFNVICGERLNDLHPVYDPYTLDAICVITA